MTMYALKPIVSISGVDIYSPKSMYEVKNIHDVTNEEPSSTRTINSSKIGSDITEQVIKFLKSPLPEVAELEVRQEKILAQLAELKEQVSSLCGILKSSSQTKSSSSISRGNRVTKIGTDLVINANPSRPPYSILALQKLWKDTDIRVSSHVHSNSSEPSLEFPLLPINSNNDKNSIQLSLIWKNVPALEVVVSGIHGAPLLGEVNFLRYLSRLIESEDYESGASPVESSKIDAVLDLCHQIYFLESAKDANSVLVALSSKLGSGQWLAGKNEPSIADVAAWSALKPVVPSAKLLPYLASWFARCDELFYPK